MLDQLRDEAEWLLNKMHASKIIRGQGEEHRLFDDVWFMAHGADHTNVAASAGLYDDMNVTRKTRSIMFYHTAELGQDPKTLWLLYDLNHPDNQITNVQLRQDQNHECDSDAQFWWMTVFVGFRNKLLRKPPFID